MLNINGYPTYTSLKRVMATLAAAKAQPTAAAPAAQNVKNLQEIQNLSGVFVRDAEHYKGFGGTNA